MHAGAVCAKMAVFERKSTSELEIDDTVPLSCVIEAANKKDSHVVSFASVSLQFR